MEMVFCLLCGNLEPCGIQRDCREPQEASTDSRTTKLQVQPLISCFFIVLKSSPADLLFVLALQISKLNQ